VVPRSFAALKREFYSAFAQACSLLQATWEMRLLFKINRRIVNFP